MAMKELKHISEIIPDAVDIMVGDNNKRIGPSFVEIFNEMMQDMSKRMQEGRPLSDNPVPITFSIDLILEHIKKKNGGNKKT